MKNIFKNILFTCFIFLALLSTARNQESYKKVKDINVLMPHISGDLSHRLIKHDLQAFDGCYSWHISNKQHFGLSEISDQSQPDCASVCTLFLKSSQLVINNAWITATDKNTQDKIRIEVSTRKIHRIEILTKYRTIYLGDIQIFQLIGYDQDGNSFSSLEGVKFFWTLDQTHLDQIALKDSKIKTTALRKQLESLHNPFFHTDVIAIGGIQTGRAWISATLEEVDENGQTQKVTTTVDDIEVIEQFIVYPQQPLRLLQGVSMNYQLYYKPKSTDEEIKYKKINLPSSNYNWNFDINSIDKTDQIIKAAFGELYQDKVGNRQEGLLEVKGDIQNQPIFVKDVRSKKNIQEVKFSVVAPDSIDFQIKEFEEGDFYPEQPSIEEQPTIFDNSKYLVKGRKYYIRTELYDKFRQNIYITPDTEIEFKVDEQHFEIDKSQGKLNGYRGQLVIIPKKLGKELKISVTLKKVPKITKQKELFVVLPIKLITPSIINLPITYGQEQNYYLYYLGGSQQYQLVSENTSLIQVSDNGTHIITRNAEGTVNVRVQDRENPKNFASFQVNVSHVSYVKGLEEQKEFLQGRQGYVFPVAYNQRNERFSNCTALNFHIQDNQYLQTTIQKSILNYADLISSLWQEAQDYLYMGQLLKQPELNVKEFSEYISDQQLSEAELIQKWRTINNFGVCRQQGMIGFEEGNGMIQVFTDTQRSLNIDSFDASFSFKIMRPFSNIWRENDSQQKIVRSEVQFDQTFKGIQSETKESEKIVLALGSSFNWNVQGGIDPWPKRENTLTYDVYNENGQKVNNDLSYNAAHLNATFTCEFPKSIGSKKDNNNLLVLQNKNQADLKLPKPIALSHYLQVSCSVPSTIFIFNYNHTASQFSYEYREKLTSQDLLTIKKDQVNLLKVKAFDGFSQQFYNYTSLKFDWSLSNQNYGELQNFDDAKINENNIDIYQELKAKKLTLNEDEVSLKVVTSLFKKSNLKFNQVFDIVTLKIISNVKIVPNSLLIYYYQNAIKQFNYQLSIVDGYGPFQVGKLSEEQNIINYKHSGYRTIDVTALKHGVSQVFVDDYKTMGSEQAHADVMVQDVWSLSININQKLIPEFNVTTVTVQAFGEFNKEFDLQSYQYMDLELEAEYVSTSTRAEKEQITFVRSQEYPNQFEVHGKQKGLYKIKAVLKQFNQTHRKSGFVELEVFSKFLAEPATVYLAPGCELGLELRGGPSDLSNLNLVYNDLSQVVKQIELTEIVEKRLFMVKGKQDYKVDVEFVLYQQNLVLTSVVVPVTIAPITFVKVNGSLTGKTIHLGTQIRLIAEFYNDQQLMSMQICDSKIEWFSESENIVRLSDRYNEIPQNSEFQIYQGQKNFQIALNATAVDAGKSFVSFELTTKNNNVLRSTAKLIEVVPQLEYQAPTYIGQDKTLVSSVQSNILIPPLSRYTILPNRQQLKFTQVCNNEDNFSVDGNTGEIIARTNKQRVGTTVVAQDPVTNDSIYIGVQTADIVSIFIENSYQLFRMPLEHTETLSIVLQDSFGRSFPAGLGGVEIGLSYINFKIVEGSVNMINSELVLTSKSVGYTLVKVYLKENPNIYDIFAIMVGSIITPDSPISVVTGGKVQLKLSEKSIGVSSLRQWSSKNTNVFTIDKITGSGIAYQKGDTIVQVDDGAFKHQARIQVSDISDIQKENYIDQNILTDIPRKSYFKSEYNLQFGVYQVDSEGRRSQIKELASNKKTGVNNDLYFNCQIESKRDAQFFQVVPSVFTAENGQQIPSCNIVLPTIASQQSNRGETPNQIWLTLELKSSEGKIRFQQRFQYNLQWLLKSRDYNNNKEDQYEVDYDNQDNHIPYQEPEGELGLQDKFLAILIIFIGLIAFSIRQQKFEVWYAIIGIVLYLVFLNFFNW